MSAANHEKRKRNTLENPLKQMEMYWPTMYRSCDHNEGQQLEEKWHFLRMDFGLGVRQLQQNQKRKIYCFREEKKCNFIYGEIIAGICSDKGTRQSHYNVYHNEFSSLSIWLLHSQISLVRQRRHGRILPERGGLFLRPFSLIWYVKLTNLFESRGA